MIHRNYSFSSLGLKNTLFNSGGGSGSFYQGDGDAHDDDSHNSEEEREASVIHPPIDPQTIELIDIRHLMDAED